MDADLRSKVCPPWEQRRFGDLCLEKAQGPGISGIHYDPSGNVAILRTTDISADGRIRLDQMVRARVDLGRLRTHILEAGDLVITRSGRVGTTALFEGFELPVIPAGYSTRFRLKDSADPNFYRYYFNSYAGQEALRSRAVGSVQQNLAGTAILDLEVPVPPITEQRAIAKTLGSLDDKIDLNRRMNQTLEEIARALFKFWFVEFGPVRAKAEGRWKKGESLPGMPADMWDLWPSEFEESEIGEIPKGWEVGSIYEVATVSYGAPYSSRLFSRPGTGRPLIRIRDLQTHSPEVGTTERHPRDVVVEGGDSVVGMDGVFRVHSWTGPNAVLNQRLCKFEPKEGIPRSFVSFSMEEPLAFFERSKVGTTVVHLGKGDIDTIQVLIPSPAFLSEYGRVSDSMLGLAVTNAAGVRVLTETRDALLPKLLSGEIRVPVNGGR